MNSEAYRKLRQAIADTPDDQFDYRRDDKGVGSVERIGRKLFRKGVGRALLLYTDETDYLTAHDQSVGVGKLWRDMTKAEAFGANGKREAIRRLDHIAARHGLTEIPR